MKKLAIAGGGDLGQQIAHLSQITGEFEPCLYDDSIPVDSAIPNKNLTIRGKISDIQRDFDEGEIDAFIMGIGYRHLRARDSIFQDLSRVLPAATLLHPDSSITSPENIGVGTAILSGCIIDNGCSIGENCYLNPGCIIAHDSSIRNNVFMGPRVTLAGFVEIRSHSFLGISTTIIDNITVGEGIQTGAGTVVTKNISTPGLYVGVPASIIRPA